MRYCRRQGLPLPDKKVGLVIYLVGGLVRLTTIPGVLLYRLGPAAHLYGEPDSTQPGGQLVAGGQRGNHYRCRCSVLQTTGGDGGHIRIGNGVLLALPASRSLCPAR